MSDFSTKGVVKYCNQEKTKTYNILTFPTHERYETQLSKTGHNFFSFHLPKSKKWNDEQTVIPENYYVMPEGDFSSYIEYDFLLSQSKFWQFQVAKQIQQVIKVRSEEPHV